MAASGSCVILAKRRPFLFSPSAFRNELDWHGTPLVVVDAIDGDNDVLFRCFFRCSGHFVDEIKLDWDRDSNNACQCVDDEMFVRRQTTVKT